MIEPSKEAEVELACNDDAWKIFEEIDGKKVPREVTEISCILVDSPVEEAEDLEKLNAGNHLI